MKTLIDALRHMLGVVCAPLYWLLSFLFLWGGSTLLGRDPLAGWGLIGLVLGLLALRFMLIPRRLSSRRANIMGCSLFIGVIIFGQMQAQTCGVAISKDGHEQPVCL
jgi:hypothetical protein